MSRLSRNSRSLNLLDPTRPVQACNGRALLRHYFYIWCKIPLLFLLLLLCGWVCIPAPHNVLHQTLKYSCQHEQNYTAISPTCLHAVCGHDFTANICQAFEKITYTFAGTWILSSGRRVTWWLYGDWRQQLACVERRMCTGTLIMWKMSSQPQFK
jgi:hypothetical protein